MKAIVLERYGTPEVLALRGPRHRLSRGGLGTYATVGGSTPRLLQVLVVGMLISRVSSKHLRVVALKPNKDLAYMSELFEAGKLVPVMEGPYTLADVPEAFRLFGAGDHKGKIIVTMA